MANGAISKTMAMIVTYPFQVMKTRLQANHPLKFQGIFDVFHRTWKLEGIGGFYKGVGAGILRVLPGTCLTFAIYGIILLDHLEQTFCHH
jgi:solute carrier family 25 folate transporter 32